MISIGSNQITFNYDGYYIAYGLATATGSTTSYGRFKIRDVTNGVNLSYSNSNQWTTGISRSPYTFLSLIKIPAASTVCELQVYHTAGNLTFAADSVVGDGETIYAINLVFHRIGNL